MSAESDTQASNKGKRIGRIGFRGLVLFSLQWFNSTDAHMYKQYKTEIILGSALLLLGSMLLITKAHAADISQLDYSVTSTQWHWIPQELGQASGTISSIEMKYESGEPDQLWIYQCTN